MAHSDVDEEALVAGTAKGVEGLDYERRDHLAIIRLNRPDRGNALIPPMFQALREIWAEVRDDPWIRVAIVTGTGDRHFCTGTDVRGVAERGGTAAGYGPFTEENRFTARQNGVWKPVICAVNGMVAGAGLHFVADADIVVAVEHAEFLDTHVNVGMVGAIENVGLTKRLPLGSVLRMTLMGRSYRMPASRAYQLGLVDELYPPERLMPEAEEMARLMLRNSPETMARSQEVIWRSLDMPYGQALEYGWAVIRMHWQHPDYAEGPRAFSEKRQPEWHEGPFRPRTPDQT